MLTELAGLAVGWGVVRSLAVFPDAGPSGVDYFGGSCLPSLARLVLLARSYVAESGAGYVEIDQALEAPTKAPVRWVVFAPRCAARSPLDGTTQVR